MQVEQTFLTHVMLHMHYQTVCRIFVLGSCLCICMRMRIYCMRMHFFNRKNGN